MTNYVSFARRWTALKVIILKSITRHDVYTFCDIMQWRSGCVIWVAVWLSGNVLVVINVVALRRVRLVFGWVTVCGQVNHLGTEPAGSTQHGHPSVGRRSEYQRKLGSKQANHVIH